MPQENSKTLSIVIPVYNEINFLNELFDQIKRFFNNDYTEIIVVDDGSTDGSSNLLDELKKNNNYKFLFKIIKLDIKTIFKIIGAAAAAANLLLELRIPAKNDDKLTNNKNGKVILVSSTAKSNLT